MNLKKKVFRNKIFTSEIKYSFNKDMKLEGETEL